MKVVWCNRKGCTSALCSSYSQKYGYICDECLDELCKQHPDVSIEQFMNTKKQTTLQKQKTAEQFRKLFQCC